MFLMWPMLIGLSAAAIPLLVHLLHRQKVTPVDWAAMQFLLDMQVNQRRRKKLDHILLLLTRMAVLAILAVLLARPLLPGGRMLSTMSADVAIVIDHSLSTGRISGERTLFDQSLDVVAQVADLLPREATMSVILAEHVPRRVTPNPIRPGEARQLLETLRQMPAGMTDGPIPDAIAEAREVLARGHNFHKIILVVSDQQRSGWRVEDEGTWRSAIGVQNNNGAPAADIFAIVTPPPQDMTNISVTGLDLSPDVIGLMRPASATVTVANSGPASVSSLPVELVVDGRTLSTQMLSNLGPGQSQSIRYDVVFDQPGSHWVRAQINHIDALKADNMMIAAVDVLPKMPVLVIDGDLATPGGASRFLMAAMQPMAEAVDSPATLIRPKVVSVTESANVNLDDYLAIIVNDVPKLPAALPRRLADFAMSGKGVWWILGPRTDASWINDNLSRSGLLAGKVNQIKDLRDNPATIDIKLPENPMVRLIASAERNAFTNVAIQQYWDFEAVGQQLVVLSTTAGDPLVLQQPLGGNGGRIVLWTTGIENLKWNNIVLGANFVPLVHETLYSMAAGQGRSAVRRLDAGQPIVWTGPSLPAVESVTIARPDGMAAKNPQPSLVGGKFVVNYNDTYAPGLYAMSFKPAEIPQPIHYAVGIDRQELDPKTLSDGDLGFLAERGLIRKAISTREIPTVFEAREHGAELWPYIAALVLALLITETWFTRRALRLHQADAGVSA